MNSGSWLFGGVIADLRGAGCALSNQVSKQASRFSQIFTEFPTEFPTEFHRDHRKKLRRAMPGRAHAYPALMPIKCSR